MARYLKGNCEAFVSEIQENIRQTVMKIKQARDDMDFENAQEKISFDNQCNSLIAELESYNSKIGNYEFLSS